MRPSRKSWRVHLMSGVAAGTIVLSASASLAQEKAPINIAPQSLSSALYEFGSKTDRQMMFSPGITASKTTRGVSAAVDEQSALTQLLDGTGLTFRREDDVYMIVQQEGGSSPQSGSAAGGGAEVDALVVTAQKREEDIQDVPIAISAFTQDDLDRSQIAGGPDLITQVPNMTFTKTNFSSYSVQLRGIGTQAISATTDPAVAIAFNNTPFIRNRFFEQEFYDLQRIEVLRGPQGTLYGRNATAGVVNIISNKPKFVTEARLSGDLSNFSSSRLEGMVNIPLVEDTVALRLAGAWTKREGYSTNEITDGQIDGRDLWSTRLSLRFAPTDRLEANLIWEHFEEDDDRLRSGKQLCKKDVVTQVGDVEVTDYFSVLPNSGQNNIFSGVQATFSQGCARESLYSPEVFQTPNGLMLPYYAPLGAIGLPVALTDPYVSETQTPDLRVIESTIDPIYRAKSDIGELQVSFDLTEHLTLQSETAYAVDNVYSLQDFNRFNTAPGAWQTTSGGAPQLVARGILDENGAFCDPQLGCSDRLVAVDISTADSWQFSQELRMSSDFDAPFNFSVGGNYLRADSEDKYYVFINSISMIAAIKGGNGFSSPYIAGVTDNIDCQLNGYTAGIPTETYSVTGCTYIDPNPIGSVNDQGHNYFLSKNPYKLISYALFGEIYYELTEDLKVTAGARYTVDMKEAPRVPTWILASNSVGYPVADVIEQEWREPTGRLAVDWKPDLSFTDETMIYASYAHGYKAGGANPPGFVRVFYSNPAAAEVAAEQSATRPLTFEPEFVDSFELGSKNTLADGKVTLNLAAFYYDYEGYQVSEIVDRSAFNRNFDATVWGIEIEADWRPLENLRLGFKGGYEKARIADGEEAVDLMDRTAGDPEWTLVRPFPTFASSCILPTWLFARDGPPAPGTPGLYGLGGVGGGGPGGCELAYLGGFDPVTGTAYVDLTNHSGPIATGINATLYQWTPGTYPGWDPATAPNNGEGIAKPLGGNPLPNAPDWTGTITLDYTIPLPNDWLATLHSDLHWQAESWWRVFDDHEFSKLDEYFTMNLAAIFTNEDLGWRVMAYVKNVTDETAITGAFLNSDDTGLTANVFLTEPRLYGLRVTKEWSGGPLLGSFGSRRDGPYPFTLELGGQVQRHEASNEEMMPAFTDAFPAPLDIFDDAQEQNLDWGDGRDVKATWRPGGGAWSLAAGIRYGKTNGSANLSEEWSTDPVCGMAGYYAFFCDAYADHPKYGLLVGVTHRNHAQGIVFDREEHQLVDFMVGRDIGLGQSLQSHGSIGIRHARLNSFTVADFRGSPDWNIEEGFFYYSTPNTHTVYDGRLTANRKFEGVGPVASWDAFYPLLGSEETGHLTLDWSLSGGVLFGEREVTITGTDRARFYSLGRLQVIELAQTPLPVTTTIGEPVEIHRSESATAAVVGGSLGLSYKVDRLSIGAGYRWETYVGAIDGGYEEAEGRDRTIDGPYFKVSLGFGG